MKVNKWSEFSRRALLLLLAGCTVVALTGCGGDDSGDGDNSDGSSTGAWTSYIGVWKGSGTSDDGYATEVIITIQTDGFVIREVINTVGHSYAENPGDSTKWSDDTLSFDIGYASTTVTFTSDNKAWFKNVNRSYAFYTLECELTRQ
ncbi:hypothetical protein PDESU_05452 [Pontiella desulfatans]|uniref:Lipocalin-like domain-containing protein n=1 Tax=Pontiella desulfatans TaxID=2750659 RepID=A0A6C2U9Z2_PONDE|nr:hypothetical protein [Pontiella desulfatans]VGO16860.1 hypothetical protein PDESU_05452 [Pontiella desulfatans]